MRKLIGSLVICVLFVYVGFLYTLHSLKDYHAYAPTVFHEVAVYYYSDRMKSSIGNIHYKSIMNGEDLDVAEIERLSAAYIELIEHHEELMK